MMRPEPPLHTQPCTPREIGDFFRVACFTACLPLVALTPHPLSKGCYGPGKTVHTSVTCELFV